MPDSLLFDGVDDQIIFSPGNFAYTGAWSIAVILKRTADSTAYHTQVDATTLTRDMGFDSNNRPIASGTYMQGGADPTLVSADGWAIVVLHKAAGTVVPGHSIYKFTAATWAHTTATSSATFANSSAATSIKIGDPDTSFEFTGNMLVVGLWDRDLSNAEILTLKDGLPAWTALSPDELFRLNTMSSISSSTGTGAQTSRIGTTLDTGDAPAGWVDSSLTLDSVLPDADVTTTGWTTAPLYSKVNDSSDATVIQATAS